MSRRAQPSLPFPCTACDTLLCLRCSRIIVTLVTNPEAWGLLVVLRLMEN